MEHEHAILVNINNEDNSINVKYKSREAVYESYMQMIKGGGLFIPTHRTYELGQEVKMLVTLMDDHKQIPIVGRIVWVTPTGAQAALTAGVGIQFRGENAAEVNKIILSYIADHFNLDRFTETI